MSGTPVPISGRALFTKPNPVLPWLALLAAARPGSLSGPGSTVAVSAELRSSVQILSEVENRNPSQLWNRDVCEAN